MTEEAEGGQSRGRKTWPLTSLCLLVCDLGQRASYFSGFQLPLLYNGGDTTFFTKWLQDLRELVCETLTPAKQ